MPGKAKSTVSTMLQSMREVLRSNISGVSGSGFFPSRPPWPLCPCQVPFLHLLDFQFVKSLRPDALGHELGTKISLGSCSATSSKSPQRHNSLYYLLLFCSVPSLPNASGRGHGASGDGHCSSPALLQSRTVAHKLDVEKHCHSFARILV